MLEPPFSNALFLAILFRFYCYCPPATLTASVHFLPYPWQEMRTGLIIVLKCQAVQHMSCLMEIQARRPTVIKTHFIVDGDDCSWGNDICLVPDLQSRAPPPVAPQSHRNSWRSSLCPQWPAGVSVKTSSSNKGSSCVEDLQLWPGRVTNRWQVPRMRVRVIQRHCGCSII